jgi:hypothetical protein
VVIDSSTQVYSTPQGALFKKNNEDFKSFSAFPFGFEITRQPKELGLESSCSKTERLSVVYFVA